MSQALGNLKVEQQMKKVKGGNPLHYFTKVLGFSNRLTTKKPSSKPKCVYLPFSFFEMKYLLDDFDPNLLENRITLEEVRKFFADVYEITRDYKRIRKTLHFFRTLRSIGSIILLSSFILLLFGIGYHFSKEGKEFTENVAFFIGLGLFVFSILFLIILNCFYNAKIKQVFQEYEKRTRIVIRRYNGKYAEKGIAFRLSKTEGLSVIEIIATHAYSKKPKNSDDQDEIDSVDLSPKISPTKSDHDFRIESDASDTQALAQK